ncbi:MAG TPA: hypothetical protein VKN99_21440 [Polyangia bacterium]|nr:hypothetical protein [Polyangia bacterium]
MKDLETRLREQAEQMRRESDPGDLFWARFPAQVGQALERAEIGRARRRVWLRRSSVALGALAMAAAALLLVTRVRRPTGEGPLMPTELVIEPASIDEAPYLLEDAALERLARELDTFRVGEESLADELPLESLLDHMDDNQLRDLAKRLHRS